MKKIILLLIMLTSISIGCVGSQEVVEPNRDNLNTGEVTVREQGG